MGMETKNLSGNHQLPALEWSSVVGALEGGFTQAPGSGGPNRHTVWLATVNADGSPHVNGVGALWLEGTFWFVTGQRSVKGRNLARDDRCCLSLAVADYDVTLEGRATLVTDPAVVAARAEDYQSDGWPCFVDETGTGFDAPFMAPSAGPAPWSVYRVDLTSASALHCVEPGGATRWSF